MTRHGSAWDSPGFLLWHATLRWQRAMREALDEHGLTHVQFVLLASAWWLGEQGSPPTQRALADHAGTDPMMTSQVVRALEAAGMVARVRDEHDRRAWRVHATTAGVARLRPALADVEAADQAFFQPVSDDTLIPRLRTLAGVRPSPQPENPHTETRG